MKRRKLILVAVAALVTTKDALKGAMAMQPKDKIFDKIDEIGDGHTVTRARLGRQLGVLLAPDASHSSEFTLKYTGSADQGGIFGAVELRVPGPAPTT